MNRIKSALLVVLLLSPYIWAKNITMDVHKVPMR
jgi:hypothetical protein